MRNMWRILLLLALAPVAAGCWPYGNNFAQYGYRTDTITLSAGNAKEVNAATHIIDPWPRRAAHRRIPANGERMVGAVQRYQRAGAARSQGQFGPTASPAGSAPPPPTPSSGSATPAATLPF